jgi:hypothetical protein
VDGVRFATGNGIPTPSALVRFDGRNGIPTYGGRYWWGSLVGMAFRPTAAVIGGARWSEYHSGRRRATLVGLAGRNAIPAYGGRHRWGSLAGMLFRPTAGDIGGDCWSEWHSDLRRPALVGPVIDLPKASAQEGARAWSGY